MPNKPAIPAAPTRNAHMPPDNHMPEVIIALIVFLPLGLMAFWHSRRIQRYWLANDREGARRASNTTWAWCFRAFMVPVLLFGFIMAYWGWVALKEDFRPYTADNPELYELLYGSGYADEDDAEEEEGEEE